MAQFTLTYSAASNVIVVGGPAMSNPAIVLSQMFVPNATYPNLTATIQSTGVQDMNPRLEAAAPGEYVLATTVFAAMGPPQPLLLNFTLADLVGKSLKLVVLDFTFGYSMSEIDVVVGGSSLGGGGSGGPSGVALAYKYIHGDTATQDVQITVYGEQVPEITADEEVVVKVPLADLKNLLQFSPGATGSPSIDIQGESLQYPNILLDVSAVLDSRKAGLKTALTSRVRSGEFADDASNSPHTLSYHLYNSTTYTNSILDTSIPVAAVKKQVPQAVLIADLDVTITDVSVAGGQSADTADAKKKALAALFEEAVAQGRVTTEDASPHLDLALGDSITLYVRYDLAQTRRYAADDDVAIHSGANGAQTVSLTFGGKTFDITFNNADDDAKETGVGSKLYAFKFLASADASVFA